MNAWFLDSELSTCFSNNIIYFVINYTLVLALTPYWAITDIQHTKTL